MNEEAALWAAFIADPHDVTLRLAYADWLQEHDDPRDVWFRDPHIWSVVHTHFTQELFDIVGPGPRSPVERLIAAVSHESGRIPYYVTERLISSFAVPFVAFLRVWGAEMPFQRGRAVYGQLKLLQTHSPPDLASVTTLIERLRGNWYEQWLAIIDLGHHGPAAEEVVPALLDLERPDDWDAEELYFESGGPDNSHPYDTTLYHTLGCIGPAAMPAAPILAANGWRNRAAYEALLKVRPDPLVVLEHLNDDEDGDTRQGLRVLMELDPTGTDALVHAVRYWSGRKRYFAAELLGEMGAQAAHVLPALTEALESFGGSWDRDWAEPHVRRMIHQICIAADEAKSQ